MNRSYCPNEKNLIRNKKKFCKNNNIEINCKYNDLIVGYIREDLIKNANPFLKALIGLSYLKIETLNIYYCENKEDIPDICKFHFDEEYSIIENIHKKNNFNAISNICDFLKIECNIVDNIYDANIVIVSLKEYLHWTFCSSSPYEIDLFTPLNNKQFIFYNGIDNDDNTDPGSYNYMIFIASFLKSLGLNLPKFKMPASSKNSSGLMDMNNIYNTVLSFNHKNLKFINNSSTINWEGFSYPISPMPLDIQALRFMYNIIPNECTKWIDVNCSENTTQTLVGKNISLQIEEYDSDYILNLDQYNANPFIDNQNVNTTHIRNNSSQYGITLLDNLSTISNIDISCKYLYLYSSQFNNDITINVNADKIKIFLIGKDSDYEIENNDNIVKIIKNTKINIITECLDINMNFCGTSDYMNKNDFFLDNLQESHIQEIINAYDGSDNEEELNKFAIQYICDKFNSKILGKNIDGLYDYYKEKNELKNN